MAKKKKEEIEEAEIIEDKTPKLPVLSTAPTHGKDGRFVAGHRQLGHAVKGSRWKYSGEILDKISTTLLEEMGSDKFQQGLRDLYDEDRRSYFQVLCLMAKIAVPTNIDINANVTKHTLVDERLAILMGKKQKEEE